MDSGFLLKSRIKFGRAKFNRIIITEKIGLARVKTRMKPFELEVKKEQVHFLSNWETKYEKCETKVMVSIKRPFNTADNALLTERLRFPTFSGTINHHIIKFC